MKNLIALTILAAVILWMMNFYGCSTLHVKSPISPLKSIQGFDQKNTIKRLEENRIRAILLEKRQISHTQIHDKDGLLLQHYKTQDLIDLALRKPSFIRIVMKTNPQMLSGRTSTVGNTLIDVK